jgi:CcmD family protein
MKPSPRRISARTARVALASALALAALARPAAGQPAAAADPAAAPAAAPTAAAPAAAPAPAAPAAAPARPAAADPTAQAAPTDADPTAPASNLPQRYVSPMRGQCEDELRKDAGWHAELAEQLRREVRVADAKEILRNRRHVVIAYGAIWLGAVGFLVVLYLRQRRFEAEIERLSRDLAQATDGRTE